MPQNQSRMYQNTHRRKNGPIYPLDTSLRSSLQHYHLPALSLSVVSLSAIHAPPSPPRLYLSPPSPPPSVSLPPPLYLFLRISLLFSGPAGAVQANRKTHQEIRVRIGGFNSTIKHGLKLVQGCRELKDDSIGIQNMNGKLWEMGERSFDGFRSKIVISIASAIVFVQVEKKCDTPLQPACHEIRCHQQRIASMIRQWQQRLLMIRHTQQRDPGYTPLPVA